MVLGKRRNEQGGQKGGRVDGWTVHCECGSTGRDGTQKKQRRCWEGCRVPGRDDQSGHDGGRGKGGMAEAGDGVKAGQVVAGPGESRSAPGANCRPDGQRVGEDAAQKLDRMPARQKAKREKHVGHERSKNKPRTRAKHAKKTPVADRQRQQMCVRARMTTTMEKQGEGRLHRVLSNHETRCLAREAGSCREQRGISRCRKGPRAGDTRLRAVDAGSRLCIYLKREGGDVVLAVAFH